MLYPVEQGWDGGVGQGQRSKEWPLLVAYQLGTGKYPLTKTNLVLASILLPIPHICHFFYTGKIFGE